MTTQKPLAPGVDLGAFRLESRIGEGGMGEVWRAKHRAEGVDVAMKLLHSRAARRADAVEAFGREVRAVAALDSERIVRVYDTGVTDQRPWLAMEYVAGRSLERWTRPGPWGAIARILEAALEGLAHAHARDVLHRDVKPANILIALNKGKLESVKLTDFGLAYALRDASEERVVAGTPHFMAPEQFSARWRDFGPWTDLYSLGIVAWYLACGRPPFDPGERTGMSAVHWLAAAHHQDELPPFGPDVRAPASLWTWIQGCAAKDPRQRYPDAPTAHQALARLTGVELPPAQWVPAAQPRGRWLWGVGRGLYDVRDVPLVGRAEAATAIDEALREVEATGTARVLVLRGPAGVGKTHIARWACRRAVELGRARALHAHHEPSAAAWSGPQRLLRQTLRTRGLDLESTRERVAAAVGPSADPWVVDAVAALACESAPARGYEDVNERMAALRGLLAGLTRDRPAIIWGDDVQWGVDLIALAGHVVKHRSPVPALFLFTAQDEALMDAPIARLMLTELAGLDQTTRIDIPALPSSDQKELVQLLLGFAPALATAIVDHTHGNPLFTVQLVGDLVARDLLVLDADGFAIRDGGRLDLPDDLHAVWEEKVERALEAAGTDGRVALELAAVLGRQVVTAQWQAVCARAGVSIPTGLIPALVNARLAEHTPDGLLLAHQILCKSLWRAAARGGRLAHHHAICASVLAAAEVRTLSLLERIGAHLCGAGDVARGVRALIRAADAQYENGDISESLAILDRAQAHLNQAPDRNLLAEITTLTVRCVIHRRDHARIDSVVALLDEMLLRDLDPGVRRAAQTACAQACKWRGRYDEAEARYERAILEGPPDDLAAQRIHNGLGDVAYFRGDLTRAERWYRQVVESPASDDRVRLRAAQSLGDVAIARGKLEDARRYLHQAMLLVAASNSIGPGISVRNSLAEVERAAGNLATARTLYEGVHRDLDRMGSPYAVIVAINLASTDLLEGDLVAARARLVPALVEGSRLPHAQSAVSSGLAAMIELEARSHDAEAAQRCLQELMPTLAPDRLLPQDVPDHLAAAAQALKSVAPAISEQIQQFADETRRRRGAQ